jgi:anti-sigma factor RsiW
MNKDKAREFFSAYYEGNLEPGLRQAFELRLNNDSALQADYSAFVETMGELETLPTEEIEIPLYLSDRIASRLEEERERHAKRTPVWSLWLRGLAYSGLAAAALAGAFLSFGSRGQVSGASIVDASADGQPTYSGGGSTVTLSFRPHDERTVVVSSAVTGRELQRFTVNASSPAHPFENQLAGTALFQIEISGERGATLLALPGRGSTAGSNGSGTVRDFAVALADRYHVPVLLRSQDDQKRLSWKLEGSDPREAANEVLKGQELSIDQRSNGILNLSDR